MNYRVIAFAILCLGISVAFGEGPYYDYFDSKGHYYVVLDKDTIYDNLIDYSKCYESYLTSSSIDCEDCTDNFAKGELTFDSLFFASYSTFNDVPYQCPARGIIDKDYRRLDMYFYPELERVDSMTFALRGRSRVKENVCDFKGTVMIKKIEKWRYDEFDVDIYSILAQYRFEEDVDQSGSGIFEGVFVAGACNENGVLRINTMFEDADGYSNRNFVGTWRSHSNPAILKKCIWGDDRLPFVFDFDCGDGEFRVDEKYWSPEWESYHSQDEIFYPLSDEERPYYKNPWW